MEESLNFLNEQESKSQAELYSPLVLAYMGDAVFEIYVREQIVLKSNRPVNKLHKASSELVKAEAQSRMISKIKDRLTKQEFIIYKRGRNAKSHTAAKNASIKDYRRATGFEALLGYLYLDGQMDRLREIMEMAVQTEREENGK